MKGDDDRRLGEGLPQTDWPSVYPPTGLKGPDGKKHYGRYALSYETSTEQFLKAVKNIIGGNGAIIYDKGGEVYD